MLGDGLSGVLTSLLSEVDWLSGVAKHVQFWAVGLIRGIYVKRPTLTITSRVMLITRYILITYSIRAYLLSPIEIPD